MPYFVYMLECCDGTLYTGWTTDLSRRLATHARGKGSRYTRLRRPVRLVYWEEVDSHADALRREAALKRKKRPQKQAMVAGWQAPAGNTDQTAGG